MKKGDRPSSHGHKKHRPKTNTPVKKVTQKKVVDRTLQKAKDLKKEKVSAKQEEEFLEALKGLISEEDPNKKYECIEKLGQG